MPKSYVQRGGSCFCLPQGLGSHQASQHGNINIARFFCAASGICPVCQGQFGTRLRCMHHTHYSSSSCLDELAGGLFEPLSEEARIALDRQDASTRQSAQNGRNFVACFILLIGSGCWLPCPVLVVWASALSSSCAFRLSFFVLFHELGSSLKMLSPFYVPHRVLR